MKDNEQKAKAQHKKYHDRTTTTKEFNEGDMVLAIVLLPKRKNKLLTKWHGPYQVDMADHKKRKRIFHTNALKKWHSPVPAVLYTEECSENVEPLTWNNSD